MDSGKFLQLDRVAGALPPASPIDLIYMRRRAFLPLAESLDADCTAGQVTGTAPPVHERSKRWHADDAFEMRRISPLRNKVGTVTGYRAMIQQGRGPTVERFHCSFRASDFDGSLAEALRHAKVWRDATELKLGIKPGILRSKAPERPWSGVSLIVSYSGTGRSYWGSNSVPGKKRLRAYIGKRSYVDAYHDLIRRIAKRDGIPLPCELPLPPALRRDQARRMTKAGLVEIPQPIGSKKPRQKSS